MASLENSVAQGDRLTLRLREKRQGTVLGAVKGTQPAQMALRLRRVAKHMGDAAVDTDRPLEERISAAKAMMDAQAQLLDVIGWPKRPTAPQVKPGRLPPPVDITPDPIQDAAEVAPSAQVASPE